MLDLKHFRKSSKPAAQAPTASAQLPSYAETAIRPKSVFGFKRRISIHLDQTGIQLGSSVQFGKSIRLLDARKLYFPSHEESDKGRAQFVSEAIEQYLAEYLARRAEIVLSLSGQETAFRAFTMPELKDSSLAAAVKFEAKRQIPFPLADCRFDFRPVARIQNNGKSTLKIALHAATNRVIDEHISLLGDLGSQVAKIYHTHELIGQLLPFLSDFEDGRHYTLINVERTRTEISYYRGSNLEFTHSCSVGSSFLARRSDPTVFEYFAESLAGEIQNSLDFYTGQYPGQFTTRIFIHGDLAYSNDLLELLHNRFGYEFRRFPTESLRIPLARGDGNLEEMSVCLPALASSVCSVQLADLLPAEMARKAKARGTERLAITGVILLVSFMVLLWGMAALKTAQTEAHLTHLNAEIAGFQQSSLYDTYNLLKREIAAGSAYLEKVKPSPSYLALALKELSNLTPTGVSLSNLNYQSSEPSQNLTMDGTVNSSAIPPEVVLAEYVENLQRSPLFENVTVLRHSKRTTDGRSILNFSLNMRSTL